MLETVIDHAIDNVWCTPDQDNQYIFQPARISRPGGERRQIRLEWDLITLPDRTSTWHLYQIGQLSPLYLNLLTDHGHWHCGRTLCQNNNLLVNAYVKDGRQFPRRLVYFKKTANRNVLVAVKDERRLPDLRKEPLYLRFYTNAYFQSVRSTDGVHYVEIDSKQVGSRSEVVTFQQHVNTLKQKPGHVCLLHNGWLVNDTHPDLVSPGDWVEYVHDGSVKTVVDLPVKDLPTFTSEKDNIYKYLISREKGTTDTIDFVDDIDVYLLKERELGWEGVYFHKNQHHALRQVTHKDYSVPVNRIGAFSNAFPHWDNSRALTIRLIIRRSGYHRPLVWEHHRIHELYRLPDLKIQQAMVGTNATVSTWKAAALENSGYTELMEVRRPAITGELVQCAYGYHAVSKILADTPQHVELAGTWRRVQLPRGLREYSTIFEYDDKGKLVDWFYHSTGINYTVRRDQTEMVEGMIGRGSPVLDTHYGHLPVYLEEGVNYRFYLSSALAGVSNEDWWDVTDQEGEVYDIVDGHVVWQTDEQLTVPAVRSDRDFLTYRFTLPFQRGYLRFNLRAREYHDAIAKTTELTLPVGHLDVFLNGHSLIENLDYFVQWPEVMIVNKAFLVEGVEQDVVVRAYGFCQPDMSREPPAEAGFVTHGLLSRNRRYDLRDDKVMRMVVNGELHHRDELLFSEHDSGLRMENVRNGAPYQLKDIVVPIRRLEGTDPYEYRKKSLAVDKEIEDYLTLFYPEPEIEGPSIIEHRHLLYSPFLSALHEDLLYGVLVIEEKRDHYSDMDIKKWVADYEWLLDFEPLYHPVDQRYVLVQAHRFIGTTTLNVYQYTFLLRVIDLYFPGKVDLSHATSIQ